MVRLARSLYCHDNYCTGHPNSRLDRHGTDRDHLEQLVSARLAWQTESTTPIQRISASRTRLRRALHRRLMPGLVHQKYGLAIPAECTQRETTPPLLCCKATFAGEKTIFSMDKRKHTRSGGRQPAVVRDKLAVPRESSYVR